MNKRKKALVFGGGSDIGAAVVQALDRYCDVTWTYFSTNRNLPGTKLQCDIRGLQQVHDIIKYVGPVDLMVTAAFPFIEGDNLGFDVSMKVFPILIGHVYAMKLMGSMMNGGRIVNMLGQCVERGLPGAADYSAAFAFLHNLGHSINGREGKQRKVSVCDFLLGPVDTREWAGISNEVRGRYEARVSEFISPAEVAQYLLEIANKRVMPSTFKLDAYYGY